MSGHVKIFDTTLRDGEQSPGFSMRNSEKLRLAFQLESLGVDVMEAGFPAASPDDFAAVELIAKNIKKTEVCGLARCMDSDIKTCWEAVKMAKKPRIHTFVATSPIHMEYKLKKTPEEVIAMTEKGVKLAKSLCDRVDFSPEDGGRSDRDFLLKVLETAIIAGADTINIPDTVGYLTPQEFGDLIGFLIKNTPGGDTVIWSTHCHNDLGLAVANSLAGIENGARQIECTINGIGERAGNASLEEIAMLLKVRKDFYGFQTNIDTRQIYKTSKLLESITGQKPQANKAIVGQNAFAHEAGIHQHGVLAHPETYEIMTPESVGLKNNEIVLGKHSGRAALADRINKLGYTGQDIDSIFEKFKTLADKKKQVTDADIQTLLLSEEQREEALWQLIDFEVHSGENLESEARVKLRNTHLDKVYESQKKGNGMVDAAYKCIKDICGEVGVLENFNIDAVTSGIDAQAIVKTQVKNQDKTFYGRSGDVDLVKAAILSYLEVVNQSDKENHI